MMVLGFVSVKVEHSVVGCQATDVKRHLLSEQALVWFVSFAKTVIFRTNQQEFMIFDDYLPKHTNWKDDLFF
jgi:hypothetical protein